MKNTSKALPNFGINVSTKDLDNSTADNIIINLAELRVSWIRVGFDFASWNNIDSYEYFLRLCQLNKISVLGVLTRDTPGTLLNILFPEKKYAPVIEIKNEFLRFVENVVKKYSGYVNYWEIWNEPNFRRFWPGGPSTDEYHTLLAETRDLIKKIDNSAKIIFGGICGNDVTPLIYGVKLNYLSDYMKTFGDTSFDIIASHPYLKDCYFSLRNLEWYKKKMSEITSAFISKVQKYSTKQIWFTEFGISPRWVHLSQKEIAQLYVWYHTLCAAKSINLFIWQLFDTKDAGYEIATPEKYFGLLDTNLNPKPIYNYLIEELARTYI